MKPGGWQGASQIAELVSHARSISPDFQVMAGAGVRPDNVAALLAATGVSEIHSSASRCGHECCSTCVMALDLMILALDAVRPLIVGRSCA